MVRFFVTTYFVEYRDFNVSRYIICYPIRACVARCFFLGTIPFVPIIGIFAAYAEGKRKEHLGIALFVSIIFSILFLFAIISVYPSQIKHHEQEISGKMESSGEEKENVKPLWLTLFCPCLKYDGKNTQYFTPICKICVPRKYHVHIGIREKKKLLLIFIIIYFFFPYELTFCFLPFSLFLKLLIG